MKKYLSIIAGITITSALFLGCSNSGNITTSPGTENKGKENSISQTSDTRGLKATPYEKVNNFDGLTMTAKKDTVSNGGLTVTFDNKSDKTCVYGESYFLEEKINGIWYQVPITLKSDYGFNDIGYEVTPEKDSEWKVDWKWLYGTLDAGEYRIIKDVLDFRKTGDYDTYILAAEFTI